MVVKEEGSLGFPSLPAVNIIASPGYQLWGQHTALSTAPVRVAMGSLLGDQMNGMKFSILLVHLWTLLRDIRPSGWVAEDVSLST